MRILREGTPRSDPAKLPCGTGTCEKCNCEVELNPTELRWWHDAVNRRLQGYLTLACPTKHCMGNIEVTAPFVPDSLLYLSKGELG